MDESYELEQAALDEQQAQEEEEAREAAIAEQEAAAEAAASAEAEAAAEEADRNMAEAIDDAREKIVEKLEDDQDADEDQEEAAHRCEVEIVREFRRSFRFEMTDAEFRERGLRAAELSREIRQKTEDLKVLEDGWKAEKATIKAETDALIAQREKIEGELLHGKVSREVDCVEKKDWEAEEFRTIRLDTGEIISAKSFTDADRQKELFATKSGEETVEETSDVSGRDEADAPVDRSGVEGVSAQAESEESGEAIRPVRDPLDDPVYIDDLERDVFVGSNPDGTRWSSYTGRTSGEGLRLYDKEAMPPVGSREEAVTNLIRYAEQNGLKLKGSTDETENPED